MRVDLDAIQDQVNAEGWETVEVDRDEAQSMITELRLLRQIDLYQHIEGNTRCIYCWSDEGADHADDCPVKALEAMG